ncbi:MAG TPA: ribonuclease HI family protein [Coriobacteriia bacterium]|nr:ribonuclease HI family protein [Coriobacteriia bacterium]
MSSGWIVNTDGGARGNPGPAGVGVVLRSPDGAIAAEGGAYLGETTNNVAEYEAVLWGLRAALAAGASHVEVRADSELVVKQMNGAYRVKSPGLRPLFLEAQQLRRRFERVEFVHVRREANAEADALANRAMDARAVIGDAPEPPVPAARTLFE